MDGDHAAKDRIANRYSMVVEWSDEDDAYIVTVLELPGCRTHGATREEAVRQGANAIETWLGGVWNDGDVPPAPRRFVFWSSRTAQRGVGLERSVPHELEERGNGAESADSVVGDGAKA